MEAILKLLIPIIAITLGCGIPLLSIYTEYLKRRALFTLHHKERMAAIEKGLELPPIPEEFFTEKSDISEPKSAHSDFGWGLFWLLGGLALLVALYFNNENRTVALYALIPIAIGLHYLIYYDRVGKKEAAALEAEWKANAGQSSQETH